MHKATGRPEQHPGYVTPATLSRAAWNWWTLQIMITYAGSEVWLKQVSATRTLPRDDGSLNRR